MVAASDARRPFEVQDERHLSQGVPPREPRKFFRTGQRPRFEFNQGLQKPKDFRARHGKLGRCFAGAKCEL